jgi:hypothetical protein
MELRGNAGNTHALATYVRVAQDLGHTLARYDMPQPHLPDMRFSTDVRSFDRVVYLFESKLYRVKRLQEVTVLGSIPRQHRFILDADGRYNPLIVVDGYDTNYRNPAEREEWLQYYNALTDNIIKPTLAPSDDPRVTALPFFGFNPAEVIPPSSAPAKRFDILHVGHNWWRWKEVREHLLPAFEQIRDQVGEIGFLGLWWDRVPDWAESEGLEPALRVETERFRKLNIRVEPPVNYNDVIRTMSTARVNIFTQRPCVAREKHRKLGYFEEFCADTIPKVLVQPVLAEAAYTDPRGKS